MICRSAGLGVDLCLDGARTYDSSYGPFLHLFHFLPPFAVKATSIPQCIKFPTYQWFIVFQKIFRMGIPHPVYTCIAYMTPEYSSESQVKHCTSPQRKQLHLQLCQMNLLHFGYYNFP